MFYYLLRVIAIIVFISAVYIFPQNSLFIPRNVEKAFTKGTRSVEGKPGHNYWQNSSDYKIKAEIDLSKKLLTGSERIVYKNNSPDTLKNIIVRLYQNINRIDVARDFGLSKEMINDGMLISRLSIDNTPYDLAQRNEVSTFGTNMNIKLKNPVLPESDVLLDLDWQFELPTGVSIRFGAYDSTSYFIAYWYPQIAVYDDIDGWDRNEYTGITEFYNDFSNFDVELSLPNTFTVWGTGLLQNPEKLFSEKLLNRYRQSFSSDDIIQIISKQDLNDFYLLKKDSPQNIWHYKAESVPDFAFGFSDHYLWDASSILVDSVSGRRTYVAAAYKESSEDYYRNCESGRTVINHFSRNFPRIPYPYPSMTIFNGAGGMEFPMIVNNGSERSYDRAASLAAHEIAHTYFPFYMGINERKYAWMDEGYAVMFTNDFQENNLTNYSERHGVVQSYENTAGNETELPLITPSTQMRGNTYRIAAYNKPAVAYEILRHFLGNEIYIKTLLEFVNRWNGKHPLPYDFFNTFENVAGQNLSWFWKPWFFESGFPDLAIESHKTIGNEVFVKVKRIGKFPVPIILTVYNSTGEKFTYREEASIWKKDNDNFEIKLMITGYPVRIEIGDETVPDVNRIDNYLDLNTK